MLLRYSLFPIVPKSTWPKRRFEIPMGKVFPLHIEPGLNHRFYHQITWIFVHRPKSFINFGKNKAFEFSSFVIYRMCPNPISPISTENWWKSSLKISSCEEITVFKMALFSLQCVTTWMGHWHRETYFQKTNLPPSAEYMTLPVSGSWCNTDVFLHLHVALVIPVIIVIDCYQPSEWKLASFINTAKSWGH